MSTVMEVIEGLERTGTGEAKLERMRRYVTERPGVDKEEFVNWVRQEISPVTAAKAKHIASGQPISEIMGVPPPRSKEKEAMDVVGAVKGLVEALAGKKEEKQAEAQALSIGAPKRPVPRREE